MTAHTTNPVPLSILGMGNARLREEGKLSDIAPTILRILGIAPPAEMDGRDLIL
jgi:2,3-bisphosphoglycerate-independent phosphoglycerate mutase